ATVAAERRVMRTDANGRPEATGVRPGGSDTVLRLRIGFQAAAAGLGAGRARLAGGRDGGTGRALGVLVVVVAHDGLAAQDLVHLVGRQGLVLQQRLGELVQVVHVLGQDAPRGLLAGLDQAPDLVVDQLGRLLRHVDGLRHRMAEEHLLLVAVVAHAAQLLRHAPFHHHGAGEARGLLNVAGGAVRHIVRPEDQDLRLAPAEYRGQPRYAVLPRIAEPIALRQVDGDAERTPAG